MKSMKKLLLLVLVVTMVSVSVHGFVGSAEAQDKLKVVLYLNGTMGDKSFF